MVDSSCMVERLAQSMRGRDAAMFLARGQRGGSPPWIARTDEACSKPPHAARTPGGSCRVQHRTPRSRDRFANRAQLQGSRPLWDSRSVSHDGFVRTACPGRRHRGGDRQRGGHRAHRYRAAVPRGPETRRRGHSRAGRKGPAACGSTALRLGGGLRRPARLNRGGVGALGKRTGRAGGGSARVSRRLPAAARQRPPCPCDICPA